MLYIADGTFCVGVILSFFRLLYLCQATSSLGLMQLCLGKMMYVIMQFMFIAITVLLAFTVAMVYLFHASGKGREKKAEFRVRYKDQSSIYEMFVESFSGFFSTLFTLVYVSLGVEDTSTLESFEDGSLLHLWANLLFVAYIGITMLILLNILIAMMNSSYQLIADNISTEHLFNQAQLWMDYLEDEQTLPVPFNVIPPLQSLINCFRCMSSCCRRKNSSYIEQLEEEEKKRYKKVCGLLVTRYMRKQVGCSDFLESPSLHGDYSNDPLVEKIERFRMQCEEVMFKIDDLTKGFMEKRKVENNSAIHLTFVTSIVIESFHEFND